MDVRCERCKNQYVVDDARVPETGLVVACDRCGHEFLLRKKALSISLPIKPGESAGGRSLSTLAPGTGAPDTAPSAGTGTGRREFRLRQVGGKIFPFKELTTLQRWIVERKATRDDEVATTRDDWRRLGDIPELASFFALVDAADRPVEPPSRPTGTLAEPPRMVPVPVSAAAEEPAWASGAVAGAPTARPARSAPPREPPSRWPWTLLGVAVIAGAGAAAWFFLRPPETSPRTALPVPVAPAPAPSATPSATTAAARPAATPTAPTATAAASGPAAPPPPATAEPAPTPAAPPATAAEPPAAAPMGPTGPRDSPGSTAAAPEAPVPAAVVAPSELPPEPPPAARPAPTPAARPTPAPVAVAKSATVAPAPEKGTKGLLQRARALRDRSRFEAALGVYADVLTSEPHNAAALAGRGVCYLELSRYQQAEASFQSALEADPRNAEALYGMAETYRYMGRKSEAVDHYEKFLQVRPTGDDAAAARNLITQLKE